MGSLNTARRKARRIRNERKNPKAAEYYLRRHGVIDSDPGSKRFAIAVVSRMSEQELLNLWVPMSAVMSAMEES